MMGLLSKIFGSKKDVSNVDIDNKAKSSVKNVPRNENCIKLMEFASHMEKLLAEDRYIARSDYKKYIDEYQKRYYGVTMLTDILRGANSKRILDNGLEMVPEYGMLKEIPRETIQNIIEWLINEHYILKTKEKYPVLHSTYEGLHYSESLTKTKLEELKAYLEKDEA